VALQGQVKDLTEQVGELLQTLAEKRLRLIGKEQMRDIDAFDANTRRLTAETNSVVDLKGSPEEQDLHAAIRCAQIMGCDKVRVFTGTRIENPQSVYGKIAETIGSEMAPVAEKEKVYLLIENEGSQNVATAAELNDILKLIPSKWVGCNWDPHNAYGKEAAYPEGYKALPLKRVLNIQVKGKGIMPNSPEKEDWKTIMEALDKDGYKGKIGLETHIFDGTLIAAAHVSMEEIMRIVSELS